MVKFNPSPAYCAVTGALLLAKSFGVEDLSLLVVFASRGAATLLGWDTLISAQEEALSTDKPFQARVSTARHRGVRRTCLRAVWTDGVVAVGWRLNTWEQD